MLLPEHSLILRAYFIQPSIYGKHLRERFIKSLPFVSLPMKKNSFRCYFKRILDFRKQIILKLTTEREAFQDNFFSGVGFSRSHNIIAESLVKLMCRSLFYDTIFTVLPTSSPNHWPCVAPRLLDYTPSITETLQIHPISAYLYL